MLFERSLVGSWRSRPVASSRFDLPQRGAVVFRIPRHVFAAMHADLRRAHPFAGERVGFLAVATGAGENGEHLLLAREYFSIPDHQYIRDDHAGARIGNDAIRWALQQILDSGLGLFHVHSHGGTDTPMFSGIDIAEQPRLVSSFCAAGPRVPHGMLLLSSDTANAWIWLPRAEASVVAAQVSIVGYSTFCSIPAAAGRGATPVPKQSGERFTRQSFLGTRAQGVFGYIRVGVVGLGGGGSHVVQQLGHVGVRRVRGFDGDSVEDSNLNRLVGAGARDAVKNTPKVNVASRVLRFISGRRDEKMHFGQWETRPELLRSCDVVVGCLDTFAARRDLEATCRRWLIPYIDIGMDVHQVGTQPPRVGGQLILSMPGELCMQCVGFLTPERLAQETALYGAAGDRPQVVWPNGVLASTAVGVFVDLVTGWTRREARLVYLSYDGNNGTVTEHQRVPYLPQSPCPHYPLNEVGMPVFRPLV